MSIYQPKAKMALPQVDERSLVIWRASILLFEECQDRRIPLCGFTRLRRGRCVASQRSAAVQIPQLISTRISFQHSKSCLQTPLPKRLALHKILEQALGASYIAPLSPHTIDPEVLALDALFATGDAQPVLGNIRRFGSLAHRNHEWRRGIREYHRF
jgi:hypothetical protein